MLYFFKVRVIHEQMSADELWDACEKSQRRPWAASKPV